MPKPTSPKPPLEPNDVTLVKSSIHNPKEPRRFMTVTSLEGEFSAKFDNQVIASSSRALEMIEVAHILIRPVYYFPKASLNIELLASSEKESQCPLKGWLATTMSTWEAIAYKMQHGPITILFLR